LKVCSQTNYSGEVTQAEKTKLTRKYNSDKLRLEQEKQAILSSASQRFLAPQQKSGSAQLQRAPQAPMVNQPQSDWVEKHSQFRLELEQMTKELRAEATQQSFSRQQYDQSYKERRKQLKEDFTKRGLAYSAEKQKMDQDLGNKLERGTIASFTQESYVNLVKKLAEKYRMGPVDPRVVPVFSTTNSSGHAAQTFPPGVAATPHGTPSSSALSPQSQNSTFLQQVLPRPMTSAPHPQPQQQPVGLSMPIGSEEHFRQWLSQKSQQAEYGEHCKVYEGNIVGQSDEVVVQEQTDLRKFWENRYKNAERHLLSEPVTSYPNPQVQGQVPTTRRLDGLP
jgi:hypothetical protein